MSRLLTWGLLLALWPSFALAVPPRLGDDTPVDAPVLAPAIADQKTPSIAFGAGEYLVVYRDGNEGQTSVSVPFAISAVRLSRAGEILDAAPIVLYNEGPRVTIPSVAFDGTRFLVVWEAPPTSASGIDVYGAYVDPSGTAMPAFPVANGPGAQSTPCVAAAPDGTALVVYLNSVSTDPQVRVHGTVLGPMSTIKPDFLVSSATAPANAIGPTVVYGGGASNDFLVGWTDDCSPQLAWAEHVSSTGTPGTPLQLNGTADAFDLALASDGTEYAAVWNDLRGAGGTMAIFGRVIPVGASGAPKPEIAIGAPPAGHSFVRPVVLASPSDFYAAWENVDLTTSSFTATIGAGRFRADGTVLDGAAGSPLIAQPLPNTILPSGLSNRSRHRAVAEDDAGKGYLVFDPNNQGVSGIDVYGAPIDPSAAPTPTAPKLITRGANYQRTRAVASNGQVFLVVWEDNRNAETSGVDLYAMRFGLDGLPLDAAPFLLTPAPASSTVGAPGDQLLPAAAGLANGDFLVVWADGRNIALNLPGAFDIWGAHVPQKGAPVPLKQPIIAFNYAQHSPQVAASPKGWLVAWEDDRDAGGSPGAAAIWSAFVPAVDNGLIPQVQQLTTVTPQVLNACAPAVAWNGKSFLVAYETPCSEAYQGGVVQDSDVYGRWLDPDGSNVSDPVIIANLPRPEADPALASDGKFVYAAWRDETKNDVIEFARLADRATQVADAPIALFQAISNRESPSVSVAGSTALVSWVESNPPGVLALRVRTTPDATKPLTILDVDPTHADQAQPFSIYQGAVFRVAPFSFSPDPYQAALAGFPHVTPPAAVASAPDGETLVAWSVVDAKHAGVTRAHVRKLGIVPRGGACSDPQARGCADGICTRGQCCDTVCDGICQACGAEGCVVKPDSDSRCNAGVSCASLSTACRQFADLPVQANACLAFGQCEAPDPSTCATFTNAPDGTACSCGTQASSCMGGVCQCASTLPSLTPRTLPGGCSMTQSRSPSANVLAFLSMVGMMLLMVRRRRRS